MFYFEQKGRNYRELSLLHTGELAASTLKVCVAKIKFLTSGEPLSFVTDKPNNKHVWY